MLESDKSIIILLTGVSGCGKTTLCSKVITRFKSLGMDTAGILTPPRFAKGLKVGIDVQDIRTGESRPLAEKEIQSDGPSTGGWQFHTQGLAWGKEVLTRSLPCDLLVIDELGPLELLDGKGWTNGVDLLCERRFQIAIAVVRPSLVSVLQIRLQGVPMTILTVQQANQEALIAKITALGDSQP